MVGGVLSEPTPSEVNRKLDSIIGEQRKTNDHLTRLNGKVAKHDEWIAIRTDREAQTQQQGSKAATSKQMWIAAAVLAVMILALFIGGHGVA